MKRFSERLPYALDFVKSLLEASRSLLRGFQSVAKKSHDPIAAEFSTVRVADQLG